MSVDHLPVVVIISRQKQKQKQRTLASCSYLPKSTTSMFFVGSNFSIPNPSWCSTQSVDARTTLPYSTPSQPPTSTTSALSSDNSRVKNSSSMTFLLLPASTNSLNSPSVFPYTVGGRRAAGSARDGMMRPWVPRSTWP